jgi:FkbM family methyltransferase
MKAWLRSAVARAGIYYAKRQYMPVGIDWLWDVERLAAGRTLRTAFDVGANVGQTTQAITARFPGARVHAFEPVAATFTTLQRNTGHLDAVVTHRLALSDRNGSAVMTAAPDSPLNRFVSSTTGAESAPTERVDTQTLDRFCADHAIDRVDLLKVDAEGADLAVFQGAAGVFRDQRVAFVFAEVGFDRHDSGHVHLAVLFEHLTAAGFEPYAFYDYCRLQPPDYERAGLGLVFANVLFVSPAALARLT